jgi:membrane protein
MMDNQAERLKTRLHNTGDRLLKITAAQLIYRTLKGAGDHDAAQRAAGVAYYAILSLFPLLLGLISVFGFFLPSINLQDALLKFIGDNLPGSTDFFRENIVNTVKLRGAAGVVSVVLLFWGASALFSSVSLAINRAWDIRQYRRHFFIRKASELGMALSTGILFLLSVGATTAISILRGIFNLPVARLLIVDVGTRLAAFLLIFAAFLLLYKLIPNARTHWRYVWQGALLAAVLFEIARTAFIFYLEKFANYQLIYGSITSIIALLVWIYYSAFIMILGAEFTFQYDRLRQPAAAGVIAGK